MPQSFEPLARLSIRAATVGEAKDVIAVVLDAGSLFREAGMAEVADNPPPPLERIRAQIESGHVWVAVLDDAVVGCLITGELDGEAHIEQVSTARSHQGRGIGRRLVKMAEGWARAEGHNGITLTTFTDLAWNAPYYARLGYRVLPAERLGPELAAVRAEEAAYGLDRWGRCAMFRDLEGSLSG